MRPCVRDVFYDFNLPMEGGVPYFYQDVKGLVSTGVGMLCDPIELAYAMPMVVPDGRRATRAEIAEEWDRIKTLPPNAKGQTAAQLGHLYARPHTTLRLTTDGLRLTLATKLASNDRFLSGVFPEWEDWPADAQLATLSMAWAVGPAFQPKWPKLTTALRARDFLTAAIECFLVEEKTIGGLRPRNKVNRLLYENAAIVQRAQLDPDVLNWPRDLAAEPLTLATLEESAPRDPEPMSDFPIVHPKVPLGRNDD